MTMLADDLACILADTAMTVPVICGAISGRGQLGWSESFDQDSSGELIQVRHRVVRVPAATFGAVVRDGAYLLVDGKWCTAHGPTRKVQGHLLEIMLAASSAPSLAVRALVAVHGVARAITGFARQITRASAEGMALPRAVGIAVQRVRANGAGLARVVAAAIATSTPPSVSGANGRGTAAAFAFVDGIVTDLEAAGLTVPAYYDGRYNVRLGSGGIVVAWDDRRAATSTGRVALPGIDGIAINCGNYTGLNGVASASIFLRATQPDPAAQATYISRWGNASGTRQFRIMVDASRRFRMEVQSGGTSYAWVGTNQLTAGVLFDWLVKYDGSAGTDAAKVVLQYQTFDPVTQVWSAWATDTNSSVSAGFLAAMLSVASENLVFGRDRNGSSGANGYRGLIDDVKILPGIVITDAQRDAWAANNTGSGDWVAPAVWHDFASTTNRGTTGSANDASLSSAMAFCTDDTAVGRTIQFGAGGSAPLYANQRVVFDGLDDWGRGTSGPLLNITQDCALVAVAISPQTGSRLVSLDVGSTTLCLRMRRSGVNMLGEASAGPVAAATLNQTGVRVYVARRTGSGAGKTVGMQEGQNTEVVTAGTLTAVTPTRLTLAGDIGDSPSNFGDCELASIIAVKGDMSGKQSLATRWGAAFHGATI